MNRGLRSSIGLKTVMAVTGAGLFLFLVAHMLGNLQIFLGPEALNAYAKKLKSLPELLWPARIGLLVIFAAHVAAAARLTRENRAARPVRYHANQSIQVGYAGRTMIWTGLVVLAFVVYHLAHFTFGVTNPDHFAAHTADGTHDVYTMVVLGFRQWPVALSYIVANLLLGFHLSHGIASLFQTLGFNDPKWEPNLRAVSRGAATVIAVGNISMPLAVLTGLVGLPGGS